MTLYSLLAITLSAWCALDWPLRSPPELFFYMDQTRNRTEVLDLWVPARTPSYAADLIDPSSAIVSRADQAPRPDGHIVVYFESNRFGTTQGKTWLGRVLTAGSRALENYPTIARAAVPRDSLVWVGSYDWANSRLDLDENRLDELTSYLNGTPIS